MTPVFRRMEQYTKNILTNITFVAIIKFIDSYDALSSLYIFCKMKRSYRFTIIALVGEVNGH